MILRVDVLLFNYLVWNVGALLEGLRRVSGLLHGLGHGHGRWHRHRRRHVHGRLHRHGHRLHADGLGISCWRILSLLTAES